MAQVREEQRRLDKGPRERCSTQWRRGDTRAADIREEITEGFAVRTKAGGSFGAVHTLGIMCGMACMASSVMYGTSDGKPAQRSAVMCCVVEARCVRME